MGGLVKVVDLERGIVEVTFELPASIPAEHVTVVGDFNDWSVDANPLARDVTGVFRTTITLPVGRPYRFRYLLDGERWENDWRADDYWPNEYGGDDSVVRTD